MSQPSRIMHPSFTSRTGACGRELCAFACVNMSGTKNRAVDDHYPRAVVTSPTPAAPGPREMLAGPAALILGDPQAGSAFEVPGRVPGDVPGPGRGIFTACAVAPCRGIPEEKSVARPGQRQTGARRTAPRKQRGVHHRDDVITLLARTAREVEAAARRGRVTPAVRAKFQAVALLLRGERAPVRSADGSDSHRAEQLKRLDGIATILATTAVQDAGLLALLAEGSAVSDAARSLKREMQRDLGIAPAPEEIEPAQTAAASAGSQRRGGAPGGGLPPNGEP